MHIPHQLPAAGSHRIRPYWHRALTGWQWLPERISTHPLPPAPDYGEAAGGPDSCGRGWTPPGSLSVPERCSAVWNGGFGRTLCVVRQAMRRPRRPQGRGGARTGRAGRPGFGAGRSRSHQTGGTGRQAAGPVRRCSSSGRCEERRGSAEAPGAQTPSGTQRVRKRCPQSRLGGRSVAIINIGSAMRVSINGKPARIDDVNEGLH